MGNKLFLTLFIAFSTAFSFAQENIPTSMMMSGGPSLLNPKTKYSLPVNVDYCREQEKRCAGQKMQEAEICLIGPDILVDGLAKFSAYRWCGYNSDKHLIQSQDDLRKTFDSLLKKCVKIKELKMFGHGAPGVVEVVGKSQLDITTTREQFASYSCLMAPNANIELESCNTGRGCRGDDFMANFAQTMLPKGGTFTANTNYGVYGGFMALAPPISINLTEKQVTYKPNSWPRFEWNYRGQVSGIKDFYELDTKVCVDEVKKAIKDFKESAEDAEDQACASQYNSTLKHAEALLAKLNKMQIADARTSKKYFRQDAPQYMTVLNSLEATTTLMKQGLCDKEEYPTPGSTPAEWQNGVSE